MGIIGNFNVIEVKLKVKMEIMTNFKKTENFWIIFKDFQLEIIKQNEIIEIAAIVDQT